MNLRKLFVSPPAEYAPTSFWFWNGALEIPELLRQVDEHNDKGVRGFFMHARGGLTSPPYLSSKWFDCIEAVVRRAHELGGQAWIYDETGWPSGTAGGRVPRKGPAYQQQFLECRVAAGRRFDFPVPSAAPTAHPDHPGYRRLDFPVDPVPVAAANLGGRMLTFHVGRQPGYIDTLNPRTTRAFIRLTHEAYRRRIGRFFGRTVPGAFTDEPSHRAYNLRDRVLRTPWTERLPVEFRRRRGYDLIPHLASLFFDVGDFRRVRYDFHLTVSELFVEGYGQPLFDWCGAHGLAFTGHYEYETPIRMQVQCLTSAMPLYEHMQIPGLDLLGRNRPHYQRIESIVLAKQPASVAHQLGRRRVLVEAYGTGGWDLGPRGLRWMADWLLALGANLICLHGYYYSIAGQRKFDAPPDLFFRQPWWPVSRTLHDHMARVSFLLSQGKPVRDVVVIHPIATAWITQRPQDHSGRSDHEPDPLGRAFAQTLDALVRSHHDFDLVDERLLARRGRVQAGRLRVGEGSYSCAIVPPRAKTLDARTRVLLERLVADGGEVIGFDPLPKLTAGGRDPQSAASFAAAAQSVPKGPMPERLAALVRRLDRARPDRTRVSGLNAGEIALHERRLPGGKRGLFLANTGAAADVRVCVPGRWSVEEWRTADGESAPLPAVHRAGATELRRRFADTESRLLLLSPAAVRPRPPARPRRERVLHQFAPQWPARAEADNVLVFDQCRERVGDGRWSPTVPVFKASRGLLERAGQPFSLRFEFANRLAAPCSVAVAVENTHNFSLLVNGAPVSAGEGFFLDPACARADITAHVRPGRNVIELRGRVGESPLQNGYLLGPFAVSQVNRTGFAICDAPTQLGERGWQASGYPFYGGPVTYSQEFSLRAAPPSAVLRIEDLREAAEVFVNGGLAGRTLWPPFEVAVGGLLRAGVNRLDLRVYGNLRNTLGPWHFPANRTTHGYGRAHFTDEMGWQEEYDFIPLGLLGRVRLVAR